MERGDPRAVEEGEDTRVCVRVRALVFVTENEWSECGRRESVDTEGIVGRTGTR